MAAALDWHWLSTASREMVEPGLALAHEQRAPAELRTSPIEFPHWLMTVFWIAAWTCELYEHCSEVLVSITSSQDGGWSTVAEQL